MKLGGIFGGADLRQQRLELAEAALVLHPLGIARDLAERLGIGGDPGEPMGRVLLALESGAIDLAARRDLGRDCLDAGIAEFGRGLGGGF
jgi:hypothetical protein